MKSEYDPPDELTYVSLDDMDPPPDCTWCGEPTYRGPNGEVLYRCECWEGGL